ncbi:hypothetical protein [Aureimonas sp. D3]|uniref:hypothetical protein n=1 Tax=Aureimonas sp. D3 TaxID=1638164 RepID=UPI000A4F5885|nr:hypothetical protein [Aureimonas sp. D3]
MHQHPASPDRHDDLDGTPVSAADDQFLMSIVGAAALVFGLLAAYAIRAAF